MSAIYSLFPPPPQNRRDGKPSVDAPKPLTLRRKEPEAGPAPPLTPPGKEQPEDFYRLSHDASSVPKATHPIALDYSPSISLSTIVDSYGSNASDSSLRPKNGPYSVTKDWIGVTICQHMESIGNFTVAKVPFPRPGQNATDILPQRAIIMNDVHECRLSWNEKSDGNVASYRLKHKELGVFNISLGEPESATSSTAKTRVSIYHRIADDGARVSAKTTVIAANLDFPARVSDLKDNLEQFQNPYLYDSVVSALFFVMVLHEQRRELQEQHRELQNQPMLTFVVPSCPPPAPCQKKKMRSAAKSVVRGSLGVARGMILASTAVVEVAECVFQHLE